ncbi:major capsid protein P2 [Pseudoalteromonas sp. Of7M-16]|uniref:major capsid protein P2 n=1 Tax=Pseudoalteromonas sp. Of7M-16 TaxID=2917756 RepID=UPI001EF4119E|nr:major capsid protein P2 [Pseudoalteromonas sp. Of7M-16]MCG7546961.1 major capsid protein P2 [Pseudoalteromonas sp. Of7M-16]
MAKNDISKVKLAAFAGNNYGEEWTCKLQAGWTYHDIQLVTNLKSETAIEHIKIDIGGREQIKITGKRLRLLNALYQDKVQQGRFVLCLSNFRYRAPAGIFKTQLATSELEDVTLSVQFGQRGTGDPEKPQMRGVAYVSDTDNMGKIFSPIKKEYVQITAAEGEHVWPMPNPKINEFAQRLIFDENEVQIKKILVKRGGAQVHEYSREDLDFDLSEYSDISLQEGHCLLDFTMFKFGSNGALTTAGLEFTFEVTGKGSIKTYFEGYSQNVIPQPRAA